MRKLKAHLLLLLLCTWSAALLAQDRIPVTGSVRDSVGNPLSGISVSVKGAKGGTSTDALGNFKINAERGGHLLFSGIGFLSQEVNITGSTMTVAMHNDPKNLNEAGGDRFRYEDQPPQGSLLGYPDQGRRDHPRE
ncbi:carboxypeptidase-like regulatory domain-containing protein [Puia sp. P3]|uniref:carboxypeptidase-like regulatory domain-containing protein n=1 Tax=Puia sp. P3 TaxID=3423952 RepID=UPI003D674E60